MGARQSKRSVDITTTPKKGEGEVGVVEGEGKVEKIGDIVDVKATTNGTVHSEIEYADKDETTKEESEKAEIKENGVSESEDAKTPEAITEPVVDEKVNESTTENEDNKEKSTVEETPENKKNKEKSKKKKWSFRSISFSKKDKSKPNKDSEKNGDVKEVAEEQNAEENATSPTVESPKAEEPAPPAEAPATNGNATAEEIAKVEAPVKEEAPKVEESKPAEEVPVAKEEPKVPEPAESAPSPVKEEPKVVEESTPKVEESKPVVDTTSPTKVEETKEVRTEEVPPPLPSSNPPSPVTVFAETTKADNLINVDNLKEESVPTQLEATNVVSPTADKTISQEQSVLDSSTKTETNPIVESDNNIKSESVDESTVVQPIKSNSEIQEQKIESPVKEIQQTDSVNDNLPSPPTSLPIDESQNVKPDLIENIVEPLPQDKELPLSPKAEIVEEKNNTTEIPAADVVVEQISSNVVEQENLPPPVVEEVSVASTELPVQDLPPPCDSSEATDNSIKDNNSIQDLPPPLDEEHSIAELATLSQSPTVPADIPPPSDQLLPNLNGVNQTVVNDSPIPDLPSPEKEIVSHTIDELPVSDLPSPVKDDFPHPDESIPVANEPVSSSIQADSLPDISTESLPSLPEQISESLPEPMSLPPVDSLPEPIAPPVDISEPIVPNDKSPIPSPNANNVTSSLPQNETIVTNGNTNGLSSPVVTTDEIPPLIEGSLKQVPAPLEEITETKTEIPVAPVATDAVAKAEE